MRSFFRWFIMEEQMGRERGKWHAVAPCWNQNRDAEVFGLSFKIYYCFHFFGSSCDLHVFLILFID